MAMGAEFRMSARHDGKRDGRAVGQDPTIAKMVVNGYGGSCRSVITSSPHVHSGRADRAVRPWKQLPCPSLINPIQVRTGVDLDPSFLIQCRRQVHIRRLFGLPKPIH